MKSQMLPKVQRGLECLILLCTLQPVGLNASSPGYCGGSGVTRPLTYCTWKSDGRHSAEQAQIQVLHLPISGVEDPATNNNRAALSMAPVTQQPSQDVDASQGAPGRPED